MRRMPPVPWIVTLLLLVAALPAGAQEAEPLPPLDCGPGDGRERLTAQGFTHSFEGPATGYTNGGPGADPTGTLQAHRSATFPVSANLVPSVRASVTAKLTWADANHDFDLFAFDAQGAGLASSEGVEASEEITLDIAHCDSFTLVVRNYRAGPGQQLRLAVTVTPGDELFACAEADPFPGCAGKEAGAAPDHVPDLRSRLYFGGDRPGTLVAAANYAYVTGGLGEPPVSSRLVQPRPTAGTPNTFNHALTGNPDFGTETPFFPHFTLKFAEPKHLAGPVSVLAWISSQTLTAADQLFVDLYADGGLVKRVVLPGTVVGRGPTPVAAVIDGYEPRNAESITVSIRSPRANDDPPNQVGQAEWTVYYDSVQFQSRVTVPPLGPATEE